jgi:hypothetical protein
VRGPVSGFLAFRGRAPSILIRKGLVGLLDLAEVIRVMVCRKIRMARLDDGAVGLLDLVQIGPAPHAQDEVVVFSHRPQ